ncbi:hypothetical protein AVEN_50468-1 [Araneus ventricosus]|uniref:Uncharacterized protein n=1 Tax=Araneus ventricosus TaxID=182803 RepID=A0A4Y2APV3_ARAVE|nr:hypothetical protein AVEN_50468-1 [Araneus ventricosus]
MEEKFFFIRYGSVKEIRVWEARGGKTEAVSHCDVHGTDFEVPQGLRHEARTPNACAKNRHWCGGRSKNTPVMFKLQCCWLSMVPGTLRRYSSQSRAFFCPPDRFVARIEKKMKEIDSLIEPSQHKERLSESGTVFRIGRDYLD